MADAGNSLIDETQIGVQESAEDRDGAANPAHEGDFCVEEDHRRHDDDTRLSVLPMA